MHWHACILYKYAFWELSIKQLINKKKPNWKCFKTLKRQRKNINCNKSIYDFMGHCWMSSHVLTERQSKKIGWWFFKSIILTCLRLLLLLLLIMIVMLRRRRMMTVMHMMAVICNIFGDFLSASVVFTYNSFIDEL